MVCSRMNNLTWHIGLAVVLQCLVYNWANFRIQESAFIIFHRSQNSLGLVFSLTKQLYIFDTTRPLTLLKMEYDVLMMYTYQAVFLSL